MTRRELDRLPTLFAASALLALGCGDTGVVVAERDPIGMNSYSPLTTGESNPADELPTNPMDEFRDLPGMPFDSSEVPHTFVRIDHQSSLEPLQGYQTRVVLTEDDLVAAGADGKSCDALRIYSADGCFTPASFWVESCTAESVVVWVRVPEIRASATEAVLVSWDGDTSESSGAATFDFFEDFNGGAMNGDRWDQWGAGSLTVQDSKALGQGSKLIATKPSAFLLQNGTQILGARLLAVSRYHTDVELGVSQIRSIGGGGNFHVTNRDWDGILFHSWDRGGVKLSGTDDTACPDTVQIHDITDRWVDVEVATAHYLTAEFRYLNKDGHTLAWFNTSRGVAYSYATTEGCVVPDQAPIHITLDHLDDEFIPVQTVDYVYVRKFADPQPDVSVVPDPPTDAEWRCDTR